jgi:hypothetical protein
MFVTAIQGLVGTFHENLTPLNQASGGETRNCTDNYFLDKGRVHPSFRAGEMPWLKVELGRCPRPIRLGRWLLTSTGSARFNFADPP